LPSERAGKSRPKTRPIPGGGHRLVWRWRLRALYLLAYLWRRLLVRTTFVAVTGSVGKTTTKDCLAAALATGGATVKSRGNLNDGYGVPRTLLGVRPWHRYAVLEVGTERHGMIRKAARLVRPHVAVVLCIDRAHTRTFGALDAIADEKADLVRALPRTGLAVLNADDPRVLAMAAACRGRVATFGLSAGAECRAEEITAAWPERLSLRVVAGGEGVRVRTRLVGDQWARSIVAAMAAARQAGIGLGAAAEAIGRVSPYVARMQPVALPSGATMLRDEIGNSAPTLDAALRVLETARVARRVLVVGEFSDSPQRSQARMRELGQGAARAADLALFVDAHYARDAVRAAVRAGMRPEAALPFADVAQAAGYLRSTLRPGDLVLLKGRTTDHFSRVFFAQFGPIGCWTRECARTRLCDSCEELRPGFDLAVTATGGADGVAPPTGPHRREPVRNGEAGPPATS
jgi:UDP-N-acetylmuramoyl-tripeptide--D-alanyl-D-alanine ligase